MHNSRKVVPPANHVGDKFMHNPPFVSPIGAVLPPCAKTFMPSHCVQFGPSEVCPRNFIIFDQTDNRSQIMFHPAVAHKFKSPGFEEELIFHGSFGRKLESIEQKETSLPLKEDSKDIDVLLSLEEEEQEECDEEEVSTARTNGTRGSDSPDSCSNYCSKPRKTRLTSSVEFVQKSTSSGSSSCCRGRKRQKMQNMVKALRGIVPNGNKMNTVAVLDEAVRYLKSLKVEVQKLGVGKLKN